MWNNNRIALSVGNCYHCRPPPHNRPTHPATKSRQSLYWSHRRRRHKKDCSNRPSTDCDECTTGLGWTTISIPSESIRIIDCMLPKTRERNESRFYQGKTGKFMSRWEMRATGRNTQAQSGTYAASILVACWIIGLMLDRGSSQTSDSVLGRSCSIGWSIDRVRLVDL